eukprot:CAMPEP_0194479832 /NCGR_PEP_ID=MMETSP0253-20130528/2841_1 /TAXON_ID=2966 /ORGANISM="Noctiluca scintillans" /LENGTH=69 /DNA_ID=CAMNT_0039319125 /DNA_START=69 /DNA_END=275 /DNA_ORIENTATION=+
MYGGHQFPSNVAGPSGVPPIAMTASGVPVGRASGYATLPGQPVPSAPAAYQPRAPVPGQPVPRTPAAYQ